MPRVDGAPALLVAIRVVCEASPICLLAAYYFELFDWETFCSQVIQLPELMFCCNLVEIAVSRFWVISLEMWTRLLLSAVTGGTVGQRVSGNQGARPAAGGKAVVNVSNLSGYFYAKTGIILNR